MTSAPVTALVKRFLLLMLLVCSTQAQTEPTPATDATQPAAVETLIERIEDPQAREALIRDLQVLMDANQSSAAVAEEPAGKLDNVLNIDESAFRLRTEYDRLLKKYNLNAGFVSRSAGSVGVLLVLLLAIVVLRKLVTGIGHRLSALLASHQIDSGRVSFYVSAIKSLATLLISFGGALALLALWDIDLDTYISEDTQLRLLNLLVSSLVIILVSAIVIELANSFIEYGFRRRLAASPARLNTLLPIARNIVLISLSTMFGLTLLSELGINVMPLLAGAGVAGIAVGFGAQALVKDIITGFIIIIEDLFRVGDVARVGGRIGVVERITIRYVQLRDLSGIVYTVPFGEISIVENYTKDFSYYLLDVGVAYRENTDNVIEHLRAVDEEMRADEKYADNILEPIEVLGVDAFADSAVVIKARIKTRPIKQWEVGREFNRRMKMRFDAHNIEIPFPHQTIYFGEDKEGKAAPARVDLTRLSAND